MHIFIFEKQNSSIKTGTMMFVTMSVSDCTVTATSVLEWMHDQHSRVLIRRLSASGSERARINKACFMRPLTELTPASDTVGTQTCGSSSASQAEKKRAVNGLNFRLCV